MAGHGEPVEQPTQDVGHRLLQNKLKILQGVSQRRSSFALDILTGRVPTPGFEEDRLLPGRGPAPLRTDEPRPRASEPGMEQTRPVRPDRAAVLQANGDATAPATDVAPPRRTVVARTVYLGEQEIRDLDFILRAWRRRLHRRVSRSEVLRQAIGNLRDAVELGATARVPDDRREESDAHV